jgi:Na+/H+ antiporter NhaD/arsenite permease-like protein
MIPLDSEEDFKDIILSIDWEVIVFLFCIFTIVEIFKHNNFFDAIAIKIVNKFYYKPRAMFYAICVTSTLIATIIEDLSVAIIFIPIMIEACRKMEISPLPYLFGITICINIASTLTPFGSAENIIIANYFNLDLYWHLVYLGVYFVFTTAITLVLLDLFVLRRYIKERNIKLLKTSKKRIHEPIFIQEDSLDTLENEPDTKSKDSETSLLEITMDRNLFLRNLIGLIFFIILLGTIPKLLITGPLGLLLFVILNPIEKRNGKKSPDVSYFLRKIDAKLIYFFICLFILVHILDIIGLVEKIEVLVDSWSNHNTLLLTIEIILITSVLSGFLDDAPVTIMFLPVLEKLINLANYPSTPLLMGFTLGINLGGNFLPQGAACDMMTLELARKNNVKGFTYKSLTIVGGIFALIHILLGIGYLTIFTRYFM